MQQQSFVLFEDSNEEKKASESSNAYRLKNEILRLRYENAALKRMLFGTKSEKITGEELDLVFDEAENSQEDDSPDESENEEITVNAHKRKTKKSTTFPDHIPRKQIIHDLTDQEKQCHCGCQMVKIHEKKSQQLDVIPKQVTVIEHVRYQYACRSCQENVQIAAAPLRPIDKALPTAGFLADSLVSKFEDKLPFYRQSKMWKRQNIDISDANLCNWAIKAGTALQVIVDVLKEDIVKSDYGCSDETTLNVINSIKNTCYMWVHASGSRHNRAIVFQYHDNRSGECATNFFKTFKGVHQCDGYSGYNKLANNKGVLRAGCMDHARRKFFEIDKQNKKPGFARNILLKIRKLYAIEKQAKDQELSIDAIKELRQKKAKPIIDEIYQELIDKKGTAPPKLPLMKAINYMIGQWDELTLYLDHGNVRISNADVERIIKDFVVGRKNWLFNATEKGARASANVFSIIQTCKANNINAFEYLKFALMEIKRVSNDKNKIRNLVPYRIDPSILK